MCRAKGLGIYPRRNKGVWLGCPNPEMWTLMKSHDFRAAAASKALYEIANA